MPNCEVYHTKMPVDTKPKIHEGRKSSKPLMEKRRRARINESLGQLKSLILEATNKDSSRHSKLEKADILEMTVKHLRTLQRNHLSGPLSTDPSRFRQGYSECIHEVARFFTNVESVASTDMRMQLINHLANCCNPPSNPTTTTQPSPPTTPVSVHPIAAIHASQTTTVSYSNPVSTPAPAIASAAVTTTSSISQPIRVQISPAATSSAAATTTSNVSPSTVQQYMQTKVEPVSHITNNVATPTQVVSGIPLGIPGTLPTGEITLVLPPQALPGGQLPSHFIPVYAQSAPVLSSPTLSSASQGPVSAESPKAYAQVHFPSAVAQPQTVSPQQISPSIATVQAPTVVTVPAPNMQTVTPVMRHTKIAYQTVPEPVSPPKTVLQPVNAVQVPVEQEPVWRPWSHHE